MKGGVSYTLFLKINVALSQFRSRKLTKTKVVCTQNIFALDDKSNIVSTEKDVAQGLADPSLYKDVSFVNPEIYFHLYIITFQNEQSIFFTKMDRVMLLMSVAVLNLWTISLMRKCTQLKPLVLKRNIYVIHLANTTLSLLLCMSPSQIIQTFVWMK